MIRAGLALILSLGCGSAAAQQIKALAPQVVEKSGATGHLFHGTLDGVPYWGEAMYRPFESNGKLAICGIYRIMAASDLSAKVKALLAMPRSTLEFVSKGSLMEPHWSHTFATDFLPVLYVPITASATESDAISASRKSRGQPGGCIETNLRWDSTYGGKSGFRLNHF